MKPIPAIVESASDLAAEQIIVWRTEERDAETSAIRWEQQAGTARATAKVRRLQIGELCAKQREKWPLSGPNARGWGLWLAKAKLDDSTAWRYIEAWKNRDKPGGDVGDPSHPDPVRGNADGDDEPDDGGPRIRPLPGHAPDPPPFRQMTEDEWIQGLGRLNPDVRKRIMAAAGPPIALELAPDPTTANVHGGSGERKRGSYCTPKKWAHAVGPFDLDPFTNKRSHIAAVDRCMLENGGDGLVVGEPGSYRVGSDGPVKIATTSTRTWWQPPYEREFIERVVKHYGHTRFCALLRFAPDTKWFAAMWPLVAVIAVPMERLAFETPEGVLLADADEGEDKGAPFPHVFYYSDPRDVTDEIARTCILLDRYEALRLVR